MQQSKRPCIYFEKSVAVSMKKTKKDYKNTENRKNKARQKSPRNEILRLNATTVAFTMRDISVEELRHP